MKRQNSLLLKLLFKETRFKFFHRFISNRFLLKLIPMRQVQGAYGVRGAQVVHEVHEHLNAGSTKQLATGIKFPKRFNVKNIGLYRYISSIFLGFFFSLAFPPFDLFIFVPICLSSLLFITCKTSSIKERFMIGFCFGFGHFTTSLYWISNSLLVEPDKFLWLIPFALFGIPAGLSCIISILPIIWHPFIKIFLIDAKQQENLTYSKKVIFSLTCVLFFGSSWTMIELFRSYAFDFPWNLIGYTSNASNKIMQLASVVGIYGLSFIISCFGFTFYTRNIATIAIFSSIMIFAYIYGEFRLQERGREMNLDPIYGKQVCFTESDNEIKTEYNNEPEIIERSLNQSDMKKGIYVRMVQPNIHELYNGDKQRGLAALRTLVELSKRKSEYDLDLIVWPESAFPFGFTGVNHEIFQALSDVVPKNGFLITGTDRFTKDQNNKLQVFNSMVVIDNEGVIMGFYDKSILVPFGEYIPFQNLFIFLDKITYGSISFSSNSSPKPLELSGFGYILPLICYEGIFSTLFFRQNPENVIFLLNITNDFWFGETLGPIQHFSMTKIRAIERGSTLLRVANNGISGVIDSYGIPILQSDLNTKCSIDLYLPIVEQKTFYDKNSLLIIITISFIFIMCTCLLVLKIRVYKKLIKHK